MFFIFLETVNSRFTQAKILPSCKVAKYYFFRENISGRNSVLIGTKNLKFRQKSKSIALIFTRASFMGNPEIKFAGKNWETG